MTTAGFQKRLSVLIIAVATVLAVWVKTEPKKPEPRPVRLTVTDMKGALDESQAGEETVQEAVQSDTGTDVGGVPSNNPGRELGNTEYHGSGSEIGWTVHGLGSESLPTSSGCDVEGAVTSSGGDEEDAVDECTTSEKTGHFIYDDPAGADAKSHEADMVLPTGSTVSAIPDPQGQTDPEDVPIAASSDEHVGVIHEPQTGKEDSGAETATTAVVVPDHDGATAPESPTAAAETAGAGAHDPGMALYSVNGATLSPYLQEYLYGQLARYGAEWFFPVALCQIYQESRYLTNAQNPNGQDKGLCQFREAFWEYHARLSGLYEYDIWNPIDQLWVYAWLMSENLRKSGGDIGMALSRYYLGEGTYSEAYVQAVLQWFGTMEVYE